MKIDKINADFLEARKNNNTVVKNLLSTFKGEYENQSKTGLSGDELVHTIAKKMIKSAEQVGTDVAMQEIEILKTYLPIMVSIEEITEFLKTQDLTLCGRLIGITKSHFNGNVDPKLIQEAISNLK
jgi:uncharacterized protein YqeY